VLTLYTTPLSANGRKPLAVCHQLGVRPEVKLVNVYAGEGRSPAFLAIHPLGKVPVLVDGERTVWESNAILQYLAEAHGDHRLWSREPGRRAEIARWLYWEASHWQPSFVAVPGLSSLVARHLGIASAEPAPVAWTDPAFARAARFLDGWLAGRSFLAGDEPTLADFSVAGMMTYARRAAFPFATYPHVTVWYERIEALDAWRASAAGPWVSA